MSSSTETTAGGIKPPFARWKPHQRGWTFVSLLMLTLLVGIGLGEYDQALQNDTAPNGVISFELARTTERAEAIITSWQDAWHEAWAITWLDYPWMPMYATTLALGCAMAGMAWGRTRPGLVPVFAVIAWAQFAAIPLDAIENAAMAWMLHHQSGAQPAPFIAWAMAVPKFAIVFVGIPATLSGLIPWALARRV